MPRPCLVPFPFRRKRLVPPLNLKRKIKQVPAVYNLQNKDGTLIPTADMTKIKRDKGPNYFKQNCPNNLVLYSVLFNFGHICRWDQCAVYILYSKISTDPGLLKIRHTHRFVAVDIQILIPFVVQLTRLRCLFYERFVFGYWMQHSCNSFRYTLEHNTISQARARTRTVERTSHDTTVPPLPLI